MIAIEISTNLAAIRMQKLPPEIAANKLGITILTVLLENLIATLALRFWASGH